MISVRPLIHILRAGSYVALLPYLASAVDASFATCMPEDPFPGVALAGVTFLVIIGYGNTLARKDPIPVDPTFWISSTLFHIAFASLAIHRFHDGFLTRVETVFTRFREAFVPHVDPYSALGSVGGLSFVALTLWMPIASLLSLVAFLTLWSRRRLAHPGSIMEPRAGQDGPSNGG